MKRSESDRFMGDPSGHDPGVSSEVYVIVTDEGRSVAIRWWYLALAIVILAAAGALALTSLGLGGGGSSSAPRMAVPGTAQSIQVPSAASTSASGSSCVDAPGYGGLGGRLSAFDANNNDAVGAAGPSPGAAFYTVTAAARGCVTAFAVQDSSTPPLTDRDLLILVSHPYLPSDAKQVVDADRCAVWKSAALKRATGRAYAQATAIAQAGTRVGRAEIEATSTSTC